MSASMLAFVVAAGITLATTPLLRRLALSVGLVDRPSACKSHNVPVPYLGGLAIALGTLTALALTPRLGFQAGVVALGATAVGAVGLLDDDRQIGPRPRLAVEGLAALAAVGAGLRLEATGAGIVDAGLSAVWIVGLTNAANLLDNMDGLGAGVAASIAAATFFLSAAAGQEWVAALAAAVTGACLAFLVFNVRPARIFMGDAGSLFLGYLLAAMTLAATRPLAARPGVAVPLMLAAIPIADTTTVVVARLRRGRSVAQGGRDHLSHRLVRRGLSPGAAVAVLVGVAFLVGALGSLAGRGVVPLAVTVAAGAIFLGLLLAVALRAVVYEEPVVGLPKRLRLGAAVAIVGSIVAVGAGFAPIGAGHGAVKTSRADVLVGDGAPPGVERTTSRGLPVTAPESNVSLGLKGAPIAALAAVLGIVVRHRRRRIEHEHCGGHAEIVLRSQPDVDVRAQELGIDLPHLDVRTSQLQPVTAAARRVKDPA
jgi:UDP-GlcNAc:undecaprenyl-phosphate GlcNAc-1-phosphate transferase